MNSPRPLRAATAVVLPAVLVAVLAGATSAFGARIGPEPAAPAARAETNPVPFLAY